MTSEWITDETRRVKLIVYFSNNAQHVAPLFQSLMAVIDELVSIRADLLFYNDSPENDALCAALAACQNGHQQVNCQCINNPVSIGYAKTVNQGFHLAIQNRADALVLAPDAVIFPGALPEILAVSRLDAMTGFVSPRSNKTMIASLPKSSREADLSPQESWQRFAGIAGMLERYSFVPTVAAFCMLIRWNILTEFGGFDPAYAEMQEQANDLVCRANRCGYKSVLANQAYVWLRYDEQSGHGRLAEDKQNTASRQLLEKRYPEYKSKVKRYISSAELRAEQLLDGLIPENGTITIAFDFSDFEPMHNGTFEAGIKLLRSAIDIWPAQYCLAVYMPNDAWSFHGLEGWPRLQHLNVMDRTTRVAAVVKIGQPFNGEAVLRMFDRAPVVGVFMFDAIAFDCEYLSVYFDRRWWDYVMRYSDIFFAISRFTLERFQARFPFGKDMTPLVTYLSMDVDDYARKAEQAEKDNGYFFVIGNSFSHKFVNQTVDALIKSLPEAEIVVAGARIPSTVNVTSYRSGTLSDAAFHELYQNAKAIIFPSHYEGFGFPLLHALAHRKVVYARRSLLTAELIPRIKNGNNIVEYEDTAHLLELLKQPALFTQRHDGEHNGWERLAHQVLEAFESKISQVRVRNIEDRLRWLTFISTCDEVGGNLHHQARKAGLFVARFVNPFLSIRRSRKLSTILHRIKNFWSEN